MTREEAKINLIVMKANFEVLLSMLGLEVSDVFDIAIKALEQEPKTGHWIIHGEPPINVIECSECGQKYHNHYCQPLAHFCSMCGCRMIEPQERSDKE